MTIILYAFLLASAPVAASEAEPSEEAVAEAPADTDDESAEANDESEAKDGEPFDPAKLMAVFDKLFPAQPDPIPERLALSTTTVQALFPDGTYAELLEGMMGDIVDRVMGLSAADFGAKEKDGKPASKETLREAALKNDPHFEERMRIMERVVTDELAKISKIIEPRLREGLARSMARRFDEKQLTDINSFLATDSGRAFGSQSMAMWTDSDVMRSMVGSFPEIMTAMPAAMKRLDAETAHLPKPKKKAGSEEDSDEHTDEATDQEE